mmetsp:Transcript_47608/g.125667  ORF Transcript_47608/g.125667 Transcript_47608/m.125667 type:complete len:90 (-) Transcript_47608:1278-1547(-)
MCAIRERALLTSLWTLDEIGGVVSFAMGSLMLCRLLEEARTGLAADTQDPTTLDGAPVSCSRLGERRARTAGTICRRALADDVGAADCE